MAEMIGTSCDLRRPTKATGGWLAAIKSYWLQLSWRRREPRIRLEEWPDYLLRDIGLGRTSGADGDPRNLPIDWPLR